MPFIDVRSYFLTSLLNHQSYIILIRRRSSATTPQEKLTLDSTSNLIAPILKEFMLQTQEKAILFLCPLMMLWRHLYASPMP